MTLNKKAAGLLVVIMIWIAAIAGGLKVLSDYSNAAGAVGQTLPSWPSHSSLTLAHDSKPTLVLFLHPKCSCSEASVGELDSLMAKIDGKAHVYALFIQPKGWQENDIKSQLLWKHASSIPGVITAVDPDGREAKLFGALTSGHLVGFDPQGRLAFSGGITIARGHMGDNPGVQAVAQFVDTGKAPLEQTRVFGCSLFKPHEHEAMKEMASQ